MDKEDGMKRLYTATDREGTVYRHWRTTEASAREWFDRFVPEATLLVGPQGETLVER